MTNLKHIPERGKIKKNAMLHQIISMQPLRLVWQGLEWFMVLNLYLNFNTIYQVDNRIYFKIQHNIQY